MMSTNPHPPSAPFKIHALPQMFLIMLANFAHLYNRFAPPVE